MKKSNFKKLSRATKQPTLRENDQVLTGNGPYGGGGATGGTWSWGGDWGYLELGRETPAMG